MDVVQLRPALTVEHVTRLVTSQASDSSVHASQTSLESSVKLPHAPLLAGSELTIHAIRSLMNK